MKVIKRKLSLIICSVIITITAIQAQNVTVKSPSPNLKVEFKRCIENSDMAFIDILITNTAKQETTMNCRFINIYDDEGNLYSNESASGKQKIYMASSNTDSRALTTPFEIPAGISYKARIILKDGFDKYATSINLLKVTFNWNVFGAKIYGSWETESFELRNIPITRE